MYTKKNDFEFEEKKIKIVQNITQILCDWILFDIRDKNKEIDCFAVGLSVRDYATFRNISYYRFLFLLCTAMFQQNSARIEAKNNLDEDNLLLR